MATRSWTDFQLIEAVKTSSTTAECLRVLGFNALGAHYKELKKHMKRLNLTFGMTKKSTYNQQKPLEEILIKGSTTVSTHSLKLRLIKYGKLKNECSGCAINTWKSRITNNEEKALSLHLDHIDGDNTNNTLENLRLLCPNCHAQTSTFCGKNRKVGRVYRSCFICKKTIDGRISRCEECLEVYRKASRWPSPNDLLEMFKTKGLNQVSTILKKDPYTVHRHIKALGLLEEYNALRDKRKPSYKNKVLEKGSTNNVAEEALPAKEVSENVFTEENRKAKQTALKKPPCIQKSSCPPKEILQDLIWKYPTTKIAKMYSVSDKAVEKWCKKYNLSKPPRGYWAKQYSISGRQKI